MTAQVFRNGQQTTFYVSDALSPAPGGGLDGNFKSLTVSQLSDLGAGVTSGRSVVVRNVVGGVSPLEVRGAANDSANGIVVTQTGHAPDTSLIGFGANTVEANPAGYVYAYAGMDLKLAAGNAELLRLKNTGIATNPAAGLALVQAAGDTTVYHNALGSGMFSPGWASVSGVAVDPSMRTLYWTRVGDQVICNFFGNAANFSGGAISARVQVPFPSVSLATSVTAAAGLGNIQSTGEGVVIYGNTGFSDYVTVYAGASTATAGSAITLSFQYTLL